MWRHVLSVGAGLLFLTVTSDAQTDEATPINPCPIQCSISGPDPLNWAYLHGLEALDRCKQPMLFDTMLRVSLNDPDRHITIRACTASNETTEDATDYRPGPFPFSPPEKRSQDGNESSCPPDMHKTPNSTSIFYHEWLPDNDSKVDGSINDTASALKTLRDHLKTADNCASKIMFAKVRESVAGVFVGSAVDKQSTQPIIERLIAKIQSKDYFDAGRYAIENCYQVRPTVWRIGAVADIQGNLTSVHEALARWKDAKCIEKPDLTTRWNETEVELWSIRSSVQSNNTATVNTPIAISTPEALHTLHRRAECRAEQVQSGDDCPTLAKRCGISQTQLKKFNSGVKNFCNTLKAKVQHVCCSSGDLPDFRPKPKSDGTCYSVTVEMDEICYDIAEAHFITAKDIEGFNKKTWGFAGCGNLQIGQKICLSKGDPPMPNPISNAICGPQKPDGEARGSKDLAKMNPCPLNVCCNIWGQCGMDGDFCTFAPADNGAPGTSQPKKNSCISNCGTSITNNKDAPSSFSHIAYFEAWNRNRPCLHMDVSDVDPKKYTHIHFSFPDVTPGDFTIDVSKLSTQFEKLKKVSGIKRIVSLGGWAFSAEPATVDIFRQAVLPANRGVFATNVVKFVNDHGLDGIDFDWEYPLAPDIPGIPPTSNPNEGKDYLEFLKLVKRRLRNKSVSIAAPASYWYLKGFPIKEISQVVDYIVYMSYDLHGQWDYGNKWSSSGCPAGNCLRSHINLTETMTSLAMITKAGVPSNKVFVGITSYARSFKMSKAGCTGPMCTFIGNANESYALAGPCTDTEGYISSAEIREILWNRQLMGAKEWHDKDSDSDIVVYKDTEWLAWMNDKTKGSRIDLYKGLNFGGVSDWAVDLDKDYGESGIGSGDPNESNLSSGKNCPLNKVYTDLDALANDDSVSKDCKPVLAIAILERMLDRALDKYDDVDNGYDKNFAAYRRVMKDLAKDRAAKYFSWHDGDYRKWFDCDIKADGTKTGQWSGPCTEMKNHIAVVGMNIIKLTLRDEDGFYADLEEQTGVISDWVEFKKLSINTDPNEIAQNCPRPGNQLQPQPCQPSLILSVDDMPKLRDDFEIPDPKEMIKNVKGNLDEIRTSISARFFDIVTGIWEGGNADVLQVLSVPVFLLAEAIQSMEDAKAKGGEIIKEEKEQLIFNILSGLLFFIPFVGEFAAMAAGAAALARMMAIGGVLANTAFSMKDIAGDPSNAAMAIMGLLSAGRLRKPKDFGGLGKARREQTHAGVKSMGPTFKKHDDSLQKVLGNCRRQGNKDDQKEPNTCKFKRDLVLTDWEAPDLPVPEHKAWLGKRANNNNNNNKKCPDEEHETTTTTTEFYTTTPAMTCSARWSQACYHYSSVMSVHTNTPDMVRWTCYATSGTGTHGKATGDWGSYGLQKKKMPATAQHHPEWADEWTEEDVCHRDEWPPRAFWAPGPGRTKKSGQFIRLVPGTENSGAGSIWRGFCAEHDGYKRIGARGVPELQSITTFDQKVNKMVKGGTTTYTTSYGIRLPRAVFEIKHWEQPPDADDGLWDNPCWPSALVPADPGFALLTNDPWYANNPAGWQSTRLYKDPPAKHLTSGKRKSRARQGRPIIAVRSVHSPEDETPGAIDDICQVSGPRLGLEDETHCHELEVLPAVGHGVMFEGQPVEPTTTADHTTPSGSDLGHSSEHATPGSGVAPNLAKPT